MENIVTAFIILCVFNTVCIVAFRMEMDRKNKAISKLLDVSKQSLELSQVGNTLMKDIYIWMHTKSAERYEQEGKTDVLEQLEKHFREAGMK